MKSVQFGPLVHGTPVHPSPGTWTCTVTPKAVCTSVVSFREVSICFTPPARTSYNGTHQRSVLLGRRMGRPSFRKEMGLLDPTLEGVKFSKIRVWPPVFCSRATFHQQPHSTNDCSSQKGVEKRCDCITKIGQVMFPRIQTLEAWNLNIQGCQVAKNINVQFHACHPKLYALQPPFLLY